MLCNGNGAISYMETEMGFFEDFRYSFSLDKNTFSAPFGIFYVRTENWKEIFQKKSYSTPQWGAFHLQTAISKWEFENKEHPIRGLYMTFFEKFIFKFPFLHKRLQMGQKMYFYQSYKL